MTTALEPSSPALESGSRARKIAGEEKASVQRYPSKRKQPGSSAALPLVSSGTTTAGDNAATKGAALAATTNTTATKAKGGRRAGTEALTVVRVPASVPRVACRQVHRSRRLARASCCALTARLWQAVVDRAFTQTADSSSAASPEPTVFVSPRQRTQDDLAPRSPRSPRAAGKASVRSPRDKPRSPRTSDKTTAAAAAAAAAAADETATEEAGPVPLAPQGYYPVVRVESMNGVTVVTAVGYTPAAPFPGTCGPVPRPGVRGPRCGAR